MENLEVATETNYRNVFEVKNKTNKQKTMET